MRIASSSRSVPIASTVGRVLRTLERHRHVALRAQVVDLVRLHLLHDADQVGGIGQVAVVQDEVAMRLVRVLVQVIHAIGIEQRRAPLDAVDLVALLQQEFGQIGAVLAGDASNQGALAHVVFRFLIRVASLAWKSDRIRSLSRYCSA